MRRLRDITLAISIMAALLAVAPRHAGAQAPADTAAVLFDVASQLEREGRTELASALYRLIRERYPSSAAAVEVERRARVAGLPRGELDRGGRVELIVGGTTYGLWLGFAVPYMLGAADGENDSPEAFGAGFLLGGPAGFLISRNYADKSLRGEGHARAITLGSIWGTWQAFGWQSVLDIGEKVVGEFCNEWDQNGNCIGTHEETEADGRTRVLGGVIGGVAGIVAGDLIGRHSRLTPGIATSASFGSIWGSAYGAGTAVLLFDDNDGEDDEKTLALSLIGGDIGLVTAGLFAKKQQMTREQARLMSIAGVAGAAVGAGIDLLIQPGDAEIGVAIPMATSAAGLALGWTWARDRRSGDAEGGRGAPGGDRGALVLIRDGRVELGDVTPSPALVAGPNGTRTTALRVELLNARF